MVSILGMVVQILQSVKKILKKILSKILRPITGHLKAGNRGANKNKMKCQDFFANIPYQNMYPCGRLIQLCFGGDISKKKHLEHYLKSSKNMQLLKTVKMQKQIKLLNRISKMHKKCNLFMMAP